MRSLAILTLAIIAIAFLGKPAFADKRVALVIGNSAYEHVARLSNPANDATAMESTLKAAGFDFVDFRHDLKAADMRRILREFADKSRDSDVAVIYFAGHGIEVDGTNYLIPIDATLERDTDVYDETFSLDRVLLTIEPAKKLRLVILDACRENPFSKSMRRTIGSREITRGLARVEPARPNTLVAYAAKAGSTAADGNSKNSPFTSALVKHIATPGLDLRKAFGFVRDDVLADTNNRQEPFLFGSLGGEDISLVPAKPAAAAPDPAAASQIDASRAYDLALQLGTKEAWNAFLSHYTEGFYVDLAKAQLTRILSIERQEKPPLAALEKRIPLAAEKQEEANAGGQVAPLDLMTISAADGAKSVLIDDVPIPIDLHVSIPTETPENLMRFSGAWVGSWGTNLHHILIVEKIETSGEARVVYALGDNLANNIKRVWRRLDATVSGDNLKIVAPSLIGTAISFTATYSLTPAGDLTAIWKKGETTSRAALSKISLDDLRTKSAKIPWTKPVEALGTANRRVRSP